MLQVIYRLSTNSYKKERFEFATKEYCLMNFLKHFPRNIVHLMVDDTNLKLETIGILSAMHHEEEFASFTMHTGGSSAGAWRNAVIKMQSLNLADEDYVLFQEDDYLYLPNAQSILMEGAKRADYVAPYLHLDRFIPASKGGNPYIDDAGSFLTRMFKTDNRFWVQVESTTLTFLVNVKAFREDLSVWEKWTLGTYPHDFQAFLELGKTGRTVISPVPTIATHTESAWQSPLIGTGYKEWKNVL